MCAFNHFVQMNRPFGNLMVIRSVLEDSCSYRANDGTQLEIAFNCPLTLFFTSALGEFELCLCSAVLRRQAGRGAQPALPPILFPFPKW